MANEIKKIDSSYVLTEEELKFNSKIFAGPGAGKTHFLVENIKNIITTNDVITKSNARKVLCITYTNAAVNEIQTRLEKYINNVDIYTIHSFIINHIINPFQNDLIKIMEIDFGISISKNGKISSQIEGLGILHGIDKNDIYNYIKQENSICSNTDSINYSKKNMSDIEINNELMLFKNQKINNDINKFKFSKKIVESHVIPIKKYIWSVVRKLTHNEILYFGYRILQTNKTAVYYLRVKFPFIFVDEFQDTNPVQTLIIKLIAEKSTKVIVAGDMAQSIYSFQGAKPSDFKCFSINSKTDQQYVINGNRRSSKNIVNFCNFLRQSDSTVIQESIKVYKNENEKEMIENKKIHFIIGDSLNYQQIIKDVVKNGGVVITRSWTGAFQYIDDIDKEQIDLLKKIYNSYYNSPISLRDEIIEHNNVKWVKAFRFIFNLWESYKNGSFLNIFSTINNFWNVDIAVFVPKFVFLFNNLLKTIFQNVKDVSITYKVIEEFNTLLSNDYSILKDLSKNHIDTISIFDENENIDLKNYVSSLKWNTSYKLFTEIFSDNSKYMTAHQAKGLEWNKVIVSVLPLKKDKITISELFNSPKLIDETNCDEFVRIYYVACTRAKEDLYIHIPNGCTKEHITQNLNKHIEQNVNCNFEYEFI